MGKYDAAVTALQDDIAQHEREILDAKRMINSLLKRDGQQALYADSDLQGSAGPSFAIKPDEFHEKPLATAVRAVLLMRKSLNQGPATVDDIYAALLQGGFVFDSKTESIAKRNVAISLGKNPVFHKLPNNYWGLSDWYKKKKSKDSDNEEVDDNEIKDESIQE